MPGQQGKQTNTSRTPAISVKHIRKRRERGKTTPIQTKAKEKEEKEKLLITKIVHSKQPTRRDKMRDHLLQNLDNISAIFSSIMHMAEHTHLTH